MYGCLLLCLLLWQYGCNDCHANKAELNWIEREKEWEKERERERDTETSDRRKQFHPLHQWSSSLLLQSRLGGDSRQEQGRDSWYPKLLLFHYSMFYSSQGSEQLKAWRIPQIPASSSKTSRVSDSCVPRPSLISFHHVTQHDIETKSWNQYISESESKDHLTYTWRAPGWISDYFFELQMYKQCWATIPSIIPQKWREWYLHRQLEWWLNMRVYVLKHNQAKHKLFLPRSVGKPSTPTWGNSRYVCP